MNQQSLIVLLVICGLIPFMGYAVGTDFTITRQAGDTTIALLIESNDGTDQFWVDSDGFAFHNATQIELSIHNIQNVTSVGCAAGQILEVSGSSWVCGNDDTGAGGTVTGEGVLERVAIWNGTTSINSTANLVFDFSENELRIGNGEFTFNSTHADFNDNRLAGSLTCLNGEILEYNSATDVWDCGTDDSGSGTVTGDGVLERLAIWNSTTSINSTAGLTYDFSANELNIDSGEHTFNATFYDIDTNRLAGSMTCTNDQVLKYNSTSNIWECNTDNDSGAGVGFSFVFKTADETINNDATLNNDADLQFAVDANSQYVVEVYVFYDPTANTDFEYGFSTPTGTTGVYLSDLWQADNDESTNSISASQFVSVQSGGDKTTSTFLEFETGGSSGTFIFQWAQGNSHPDNLTLLEGSWIEFRKVS